MPRLAGAGSFRARGFVVLAASSTTAAAGSGRWPDPVESSTAAALRRGGRVFVAIATGSPVFELVPRLAGAGSFRARGFFGAGRVQHHGCCWIRAGLFIFEPASILGPLLYAFPATKHVACVVVASRHFVYCVIVGHVLKIYHCLDATHKRQNIPN